ncbi:hypothetical protein BO221_41475 [Archangium sp. Cb G35]|uniref:hypothetical protein n=1 Tax=Archangium sp. Cb G35 TaxID=1920190 RepID=UPI0009368508|nr:hypothetical protein [Archangium sp. Cb G35]OJT18527.1 hypothetical protein BO221_41475 [Archangium sp. Cb G35]
MPRLLPLPVAVALLILCTDPATAAQGQGEEPVTPPASASALDEWMQPATIENPSESPSAPEQATPAPAQVPIVDTGPSRAPKPERERDLLTLGGLYYQRAEFLGFQGLDGQTMQPVLPSLADIFMDVQPSDELRGFVRGRLLYDALDPVLSTPQVTLDQFWFRFSLGRSVFFTIGRQQLRWGSSKVWNPTDFLQEPNPRPLDVLDLRTGIDMLKVNIPWEATASNLWLIATADLKGPATQRLRYGGAVRAEMALGPSELSLTAAFQQGRRPRYGLGWSVGVGPLDFNTELALVRDSLTRGWRRTAEGFSERPYEGPKLLASGGVEGTFRLGDVYRANVRLEGFYNALGYEDRALLTWVHSTGDYRSLFFGRAYAMAQVRVDRRSIAEPSAGITVISNLSDRSFLGRLDAGLGVLRDVNVQAYLEMPFGERGGEFLFEPDATVAELPSSSHLLFRAGLGVTIRM